MVWGSLDHPHVLPFYGLDTVNFFPSMCMVSPWMENGNLLEYVTKEQRTEAEINRLVRDFSEDIVNRA
jgi:hypothetical protein